MCGGSSGGFRLVCMSCGRQICCDPDVGLAYRACGKYAVIRMSVERGTSMYNKWTRVSVAQLDFTAVVLSEKTNLFHTADRVDIAGVRRTF